MQTHSALVGLIRISRSGAACRSPHCGQALVRHPDEGEHLAKFPGKPAPGIARIGAAEDPQERDAVRATIDRIEMASGKRPVGWLGAGLAETWNTLDYLAEAGIRYVCDWVNDDQPYLFDIGNPPLVSLPYSVQTNDVPAYFEMTTSACSWV